MQLSPIRDNRIRRQARLDQRPDVCFHGRMLHQPHARFETPAARKGGAAALVLSPHASARGRAFEFPPGPIGWRLICPARPLCLHAMATAVANGQIVS
jgi:hypothetical protein